MAWNYWRTVAAAVCVLVPGCFGPGRTDSAEDKIVMDDDIPAGQCLADVDCCESSDQCDGGVCVAQFDDERSSFVCVEACVDNMDEANWCRDTAACCDPTAVCSLRGYCLSDEASETTLGDGIESGASGSGDLGSSNSGPGTSASGTSETGGSDSGIDQLQPHPR